jgi:hypothetical protein
VAIRLGDIFVAIRGDDSKLDSDLSAAKGKFSGFAAGIGTVLRGGLERVGQIGTELALNAAKASIDFVKGAVDEASNLNESISKVNTVFGDSADEINAWAKTASTAFGQSRQQALEATGTFGNLFSALGFGGDAAKDMSIGLVELASDLASFNNISVDEAIIKLRAGIVGETEPLRTLGVNLSAAAVEAYALKNGLAASKDAITESDKVTARYAIIMEQTALAQGDFARTSTGLANSQRILAAQWTDLKATVGTALLPVITTVAGIFSRLATAIMPPLASFLEQHVTPAMQELADALQNLVLNSSFEWTPEFKQVKLGDLFEFVQSDGLNLTRIKLSDFFDLTLSSQGIEQLTLGDFFSFVADEGAQINIADYVNFVYDATTGAVALTLGDVFSFVNDAGGTVINLNDYVRFNYDKDSGGVALTLGDVFSFVNAGEITTINLKDYVSFFYNNETGKVRIRINDLFTFGQGETPSEFSNDAAALTFNLADYVTFFYDKETKDVVLYAKDLITFAQDENGRVINLANFVTLVYDNEGKLIELEAKNLISIKEQPEGGKFTLGNFFDFSSKDGVGIAKFDLKDFFSVSEGTVFPVTQAQLFDFSQKVTIAAYSLRDFLAWVTLGGGEEKVTSEDLFGLSEKQAVEPYTLGDFFSWMGVDTVQITWGDLFNLTVGQGIDKLQIGDFINLESLTASALFGKALSELSSGLGQALEDAAANLGEKLKAPQWVMDLINWKPFGGKANLEVEGPTWSEFIESFKWGDFIDDFDWGTWISELLWPDATQSFSWATWVSNLLWPGSIASFSWKSFITGINLSALVPEFPGWTALFDQLNPFGDAPAGDNSTATSDGSIGGSGPRSALGRSSFGATALQPAFVVNGDINIRSAEDLDTLAYKVASRMAGR